MAKGKKNKAHIFVLTLITIVVLGISIYIHSTGNYFVYRSIRGVAPLAFLIVLLLYKRQVSWVIPSFFILSSLSSILIIWYEINSLATAALALNFFAYLVLIIGIFPKVDLKKMNVLFASVFVILILLNAYLLYVFISMMKSFALSDLHYILMLAGGMNLVLAGFFTLLYNHRFSSVTSLIFTIGVFVLIFGEIFRAIGYYDFGYGNYSVYISRALFLLAGALFVHFEIQTKDEIEVLGRK